ncbi:MAG: response regulator [Polyangiaceae bacterium]|nr:response regulator [Polyangiaceae bacterium]
MIEDKAQVLWVDDDDPERFVYERFKLQKEGFFVTWARDVEEAASLLASQKFDAMILDQMIAGNGVDEQYVIWAGCTLLQWLRGAPPSQRQPERAWPKLSRITALEQNRHLPVAILSAYHDPEVLRAIYSASDQDKKPLFFGKPVNDRELLEFLRGACPKQKTA